jgi:muramoyltetrapeptide carboxypeptidase LdcA involved in peptidoglycan recycling
VLKEFKHKDLPIMYNINIGHAYPIGILPLGTNIEVDFDNKKITLLESATK